MYGNTNMYKRALDQLDDEKNGLYTCNDKLYDEKMELMNKLSDLQLELSRCYKKLSDVEDDLTHVTKEYYKVIKDNAEVGALNVDLQMELEAYRTIENKTGKSPEEIIDLVSNLSGVVDAIRSKSPKCKCSTSGE